MFIEQAYRYLHDAWRYIVGFIVIFIVWQLGSIPLLAGVIFKLLAEGGDITSLQEDPNQVMGVLDSNLTLFLMLLSFAIGLLAIYLWVKFVHKQGMTPLTTTRKKIDWGRFWFGFGLIAIFTIGTTLLDYFYLNPESYELQFKLTPFLILVIIAIIMVPLQTSFEEYLFRGYLMQGLGVITKTRWVPLLATSVIFGGLHYFNPEVDKMGDIIMVFYIGTGLLLGIMTLMDEGMELALGFHAGNNLIAALLVTADWTAFKTHSILKDVSDPTAGFDVLVPVLIIYPVFLALMAWKYKWTGWREKLFGEVVPPKPDVISEIGNE